MDEKVIDEIRERISRYRWYHRIQVADGVYTESECPSFQRMWDFNLSCMDAVDLRGKRVLDIGCRDGLFSFEAERRGAAEVIGIDNDLSCGAVDALIPFLRSSVRMHELNVYDLSPERFGVFDVVLFFGVLYHLRYPFWGLKKACDCVADGGFLLIESGMLDEPRLEGRELMYCPFEQSPYEETSVTFFNRRGLCETMRSYNFDLVQTWTIPDVQRSGAKQLGEWVLRSCGGAFGKKHASCRVTRQFFVFRKGPQKVRPWIGDYWNTRHDCHTREDSGPAGISEQRLHERKGDA